MTSSVIYEGDKRTSCIHLASNSKIETDAPIDNNGKGERFSPTDLLASSLAACMLTIMSMKADEKGIDIKGVRIDVSKIMAKDPRRISQIDLLIHIPESIQSIDRTLITILKKAALACPVGRSLHPDIVINHNWGAWE